MIGFEVSFSELTLEPTTRVFVFFGFGFRRHRNAALGTRKEGYLLDVQKCKKIWFTVARKFGGYRGVAEGTTALTLFRTKSPKIPTLCRTTPSSKSLA